MCCVVCYPRDVRDLIHVPMEGLHCTNCKSIQKICDDYNSWCFTEFFFFFILLRVSFLDVLCTCMICFLSLQIGIHISMYPAMLHSIPLATFASLIAPFGGFFASGFKRAFKVKVSNHYCTHFWLSLNIFDSFLGFCWCHSRAWWIDGSVWLSVANGILC